MACCVTTYLFSSSALASVPVVLEPGQMHNEASSAELALEPPSGAAAKRVVVYVNFDGVDRLTAGVDDSRNNVATDPAFDGKPYPPYGDGPKKDALYQAILADFAAYNVHFTRERPASGDYVMALVGPGNPFPPPYNNALGYASEVDCDDVNPNNIVYGFFSANDQWDANTQANSTSQEIAHAWGLEHVQNDNDIMNPTNDGGDDRFLDGCNTIAQGQNGIRCPMQHALQCGAGQQNSHQEILAVIGPPVVDSVPPTAQVTQPEDGAAFGYRDLVTIEVAASDDQDLGVVRVFSGETLLGSDREAPYVVATRDLDEGVHRLWAEVEDLGGNVGISGSIEVVVGEASATVDSGGPPPTTRGTGDGDGGLETGGGTVGERPTSSVGVEDDLSRDGCGCRSGGGSLGAAAAWWLACALLLPGFRRRATD